MFIHGSSDPWYAMRMTDIIGKDNIKLYISNKEAHGAKIDNLSEADRDAAWGILDK